MPAARTVKTIPATLTRFTSTPLAEQKKRRTAGYARVSTDSDEQFTSYEAQVDYYTNYIKSREDWEFVAVYTDAGITGTSTKHREGFKRMVEDALAGRIDLIITKSVSRFARNTVDSLTTIRKLKEHGVECFFEKENIWTFDSKGELLLTIMSSLAQEESRSISENCTICRRQSHSPLWAIPWLRPWRGRKPGGQPGTGEGGAADFPGVPPGQDALRHRQRADRRRHSDARREDEMERHCGKEHPRK